MIQSPLKSVDLGIELQDAMNGASLEPRGFGKPLGGSPGRDTKQRLFPLGAQHAQAAIDHRGLPNTSAPVISLRCGSARPEKTDPTLLEAGHGDGDLCLVQRPVEIDRSVTTSTSLPDARRRPRSSSSPTSSSSAGRHVRPDALARCSSRCFDQCERPYWVHDRRATCAREASERATSVHDTRAH